MKDLPEASAGPYTLVIPPNGRATLYQADSLGVSHEVPFGVNLDALVQFAGEVIRLNALIAELRATRTARIEALEAALHKIIAECTYRGAPIKTPQSSEEMFMIARAALDKDTGQ